MVRRVWCSRQVLHLVADGDGVGDENLLRVVVVGIRGHRDHVICFPARAGGRGHAPEALEDTLQLDVDVGVDDDRDEEDGDAPAVGEAIAQVESVAPDPAPVATDVTV